MLIGFSTFRGTVSAASEWDKPVEKKKIIPALPESYEALFHLANEKNFILLLQQNEELKNQLHYNKLQRAIGVLYLPATERYSHYYYVNLLSQFDAIIHFDKLMLLSLWNMHQNGMIKRCSRLTQAGCNCICSSLKL
jgi:erythromycin esterase-like protein